MTMSEEWRPVVDSHSYEVSNLGRVRSVDRIVAFKDGRKRLYKGQILKPSPDKDGYLTVQVGRASLQKVHILVLESFVGPRPDGYEACHGILGRVNNTVDNLRWDTVSENRKDTVRHGNHNGVKKTECINGHEFSEENTLLLRSGSRVCLTCKRRRNREYKERIKNK